MGILNVTPDSFSDGGRYDTADRALRHCEEMIKQGADIIDIGGESSRPNHVKISAQEEIDRVMPALSAIKKEFDIPISLDTCKSEVAAEGVKAGVDMINDIWGLKYDGDMAKVIAKSGVACCLMHNRVTPDYTDYMRDIYSDLEQSLALANSAGIAKDKIVLDIGIGFGKTQMDNIIALNRMDELFKLDCPLLLGVSRKSVIGAVLGDKVDDREAATVALTALAAVKGVQFVRVHNVGDNVKAAKMIRAVTEERLG
ncbi:MAG: dihydropteroate synthase [Clostridia bacterium]|nr:dihydropteroate synthase [Clostridia bacterium]